MIKTKLYLDVRYKNKEDKSHLCLRLSNKGKTRFIPLGLMINQKYWDSKAQKVIKLAKYKNINAKIEKQLLKIEKYILIHELEINQMDIDFLKKTLEVELKRTSQTPKSVITQELYGYSQQGTLKTWGHILIQRLLKSQRKSTADGYNTAINAFITFNKGNDIQLIDINESFLEEFKAYGFQEIKDKKGIVVKKIWKPNTIAGYMEGVRSIMNRAIKEKKEFIPLTHQPFKNVSLTRETIEVDSIHKIDIVKIRNLDLEIDSAIWKAKARFLFMFNSQGLNFTDLAKLKVRDNVNHTISYYRSKTSKRKKRKKIIVSLTKESQDIWNYFTKNKSKNDYAFDILGDESDKYNHNLKRYNESRKSSNPAVTEKNRIKSRMKTQNKLLGEISILINSRIKITTYDARYGWVNAALDSGISEEIIGKGLGHSNLAVTRTYFEERHKRTDLGDLNEMITS